MALALEWPSGIHMNMTPRPAIIPKMCNDPIMLTSRTMKSRSSAPGQSHLRNSGYATGMFCAEPFIAG